MNGLEARLRVMRIFSSIAALILLGSIRQRPSHTSQDARRHGAGDSGSWQLDQVPNCYGGRARLEQAQDIAEGHRPSRSDIKERLKRRLQRILKIGDRDCDSLLDVGDVVTRV